MKVGSIVELIDDTNWRNLAPCKLPVKGVPYTIRGIIKWHDGTGVYLEEIVNRNFLGSNTEGAFMVERFRELLPPIENIEKYIEENTIVKPILEPVEL